MKHRSEPTRWATALESRRNTHHARRKIGSVVPSRVLGHGPARLCCGAVAGTSVHGPMT